MDMGPNELDSDCAGAMGGVAGGVGVASGGGSLRSNQDNARDIITTWE